MPAHIKSSMFGCQLTWVTILCVAQFIEDIHLITLLLPPQNPNNKRKTKHGNLAGNQFHLLSCFLIFICGVYCFETGSYFLVYCHCLQYTLIHFFMVVSGNMAMWTPWCSNSTQSCGHTQWNLDMSLYMFKGFCNLVDVLAVL